MAANIYVQLSANGEAISGDVIAPNYGGIDVSSDHIEAYGFYHEAQMPASDLKTGAATFAPISFIKQTDRATPLLWRAFSQGQAINASIKFFAINASSGLMFLHHVYQVEQGRILTIRTELLNNLAAENNAMPVLERITLTYRSFKVIHAPTSAQWTVPVVRQ